MGVLLKFKESLERYLRESHAELKRVAWPTRKQTTNHTIMVIIFSLSIAFFLGAFDILFTTLIQEVIL